MDVYLIRHAEAIERELSDHMPDEERTLTDLGHAQAANLAALLPTRGPKIERLFISPLVRTKQTADTLISAWGLTGDSVIECPELAPEGRCRKVAKAVNKHAAAVVGLVGHRPDLNELAAWLIGNKKAKIAFDKGGVALVHLKGDELEKGAGELVWLATSSWFEPAAAGLKTPASPARRTRKRRAKPRGKAA